MAAERLLIGTSHGVVIVRTRDNGVNWRLETKALKDQRITTGALVVHPGNRNIVYAGTRGGGVFRSSDGGITWEERSNGLTRRHLRCLTMDPRRPEVLYAGTGPVGLFITRDEGNSWQEMEGVTKLGEKREWPYPATVIDPHVRSILPDPSNPKLIFASIQIGGVIWSEDEGKTWTDSVEGIDPDVHWLDLNPQTSEIYATTGGGAHWTYPASPQPHWGKAVYKSIDRGRTWTSLTDHLPWDYGEPMRHHPTDGAMLYVGVARGVPTEWNRPTGAEGSLIRTADGGKTWQHLTGGLPELLYDPIGDLTFDPADPETMFMATGRGDAAWGQVFVSRDRGATWRHLIFTASVSALACGPS